MCLARRLSCGGLIDMPVMVRTPRDRALASPRRTLIDQPILESLVIRSRW
jgi:hypothetical protein